MSKWPLVPLGDVLTKSEDWVVLEPERQYNEVTIRLWGKGVVLRRQVIGAEIASSRRLRVRTNQFILSRIDARNGAIGLVPESLNGAVVSTDFPTFALNANRVIPPYLGWMSRTSAFVELCKQASEGTTNRVRLQENRFLHEEIPLPPLAEQRRIVAQIEALAAKIKEARELRQQAAGEAVAYLAATSLALFSSLGPLSTVGEVCEVIDPNPSHRYPVYVPNGIPIVSSSEFVGDDGIDPTRARQVPEAFYEATLGRFNVGAGDVVFSRKGKVGYARLHPDAKRLAMTHTLCVMKPDRSRLEPRYLLHFARSPFFLEELTGTMNQNVGVPTLGLGVIRDAGIPLVHLSEQRHIIAHLDSLQSKVDMLKKLQAETAAELAALLPSILDKAFKGEL